MKKVIYLVMLVLVLFSVSAQVNSITETQFDDGSFEFDTSVNITKTVTLVVNATMLGSNLTIVGSSTAGNFFSLNENTTGIDCSEELGACNLTDDNNWATFTEFSTGIGPYIALVQNFSLDGNWSWVNITYKHRAAVGLCPTTCLELQYKDLDEFWNSLGTGTCDGTDTTRNVQIAEAIDNFTVLETRYRAFKVTCPRYRYYESNITGYRPQYPRNVLIRVNNTIVFNHTGNLTGTNQSIDLDSTLIESYIQSNATIPIQFSAIEFGNLEVLNLSIEYTRNLRLRIFDANTDKLVTSNVTATIISPTFAKNVTVVLGETNITDIPNGAIEIRYGGGLYAERRFFTTISGFQTSLDLYTILLSNGTLIIFKAITEKGVPIVNHTLKVQRYFINDNAFNLIGMEKTDLNGESGMFLVPNTVPYIFIIESNSGAVIYRSDEVKIFSSIINLQADILIDVLESHIKLRNITSNLSWNNDTKTLSYFFNDATGVVVLGCLEVKLETTLTSTTLGPNCTASNSGTIIMEISPFIQNGTSYTAFGYVDTSTRFSRLTTDILPDFVKAGSIFDRFGLMGLFMSYLFIVTMFFLGLPNFSIAVGYSIISMIVLNLVGVSFFGTALIISISIMGLVIARGNRI